MSFLRNLAILFFIIMAIYTGIVIAEFGPNPLSPFIADLMSLTWSGQFALDFGTYLILSALWIAWRHRFSSSGIVLALLAPIGGMLYFSVYLIVAIARAEGDIKALLLGQQAERSP